MREVGGQSATITDLDGNYALSVPKGTTLKLSYTGYKDMQIRAGENATMQPDIQGLDDVVVIGYGTVKNVISREQ